MYNVLGADQKEYGPASSELIQQWITERRLNARSLIRHEDVEGWKPLAEFPEFADALDAAQPSPPAMQPGGRTGVSPRRLNGLAVRGLVMGILAMSLGMCCCYGIPFNLFGAIFSGIALNQISRDPNRQSGRELALIGLILSVVSLTLGLLAILFGFTMNYHEIMRGMRGM